MRHVAICNVDSEDDVAICNVDFAFENDLANLGVQLNPIDPPQLLPTAQLTYTVLNESREALTVATRTNFAFESTFYYIVLRNTVE